MRVTLVQLCNTQITDIIAPPPKMNKSHPPDVVPLFVSFNYDLV